MKVNWKRGRAALLIWGARLLLCLLVGGMLAGTGGVVVSRMWAEAVSRPWIVPLNQAPERDVAIVFGGGVYPNGVPSRALRVRLDTALQLYRRGRVRRLLLSGSRAYQGRYDEVGTMAAYLMQRGVPESALMLDPLGVRTLETCRRAREVFGLRRALLVTHRYHLPRAILLCRAWGIEAIGVPAQSRRPPWIERVLFWYVRESLATVRALLDLLWLSPPPGWAEQEAGRPVYGPKYLVRNRDQASSPRASMSRVNRPSGGATRPR